MAKLAHLFGSQRQDWTTPPELFKKLDSIYHFTHDLAATKENSLCPQYFTEKENSLVQTWRGSVGWLNPPFGSRKYPLRLWVEKSYREACHPNTRIVMLMPVRSNTNWWGNFVMKSVKVMYIQGRIKFSGAKHPGPWPLCLVEFSPDMLVIPTKHVSFVVELIPGSKLHP